MSVPLNFETKQTLVLGPSMYWRKIYPQYRHWYSKWWNWLSKFYRL